MIAKRKASSAASQSSATIGFKVKPWLTADKVFQNSEAIPQIAIKVEDYNANFAWPRHESGFIYIIAPATTGSAGSMAGFVPANGSSISSYQSGEGDIRHALIESDLADCMGALSGQLVYLLD